MWARETIAVAPALTTDYACVAAKAQVARPKADRIVERVINHSGPYAVSQSLGQLQTQPSES